MHYLELLNQFFSGMSNENTGVSHQARGSHGLQFAVVDQIAQENQRHVAARMKQQVEEYIPENQFFQLASLLLGAVSTRNEEPRV